MKYICCHCGKEKECIRIRNDFSCARVDCWTYICMDCYKKICNELRKNDKEEDK